MFKFHTGTSGIATDLVLAGSAAAVDNVFDGVGGTWMGWIEFASYGQGGFGRIADKGEARLYAYDTGDRLGFSQGFSTTGGIWTTPTSSLLINTLYHVSARYDSDSSANDPSFTINGVAAATTQVTGPSGSRTSDAGDRLTIGGDVDYDRAFDGAIGDFRIYNRQLSDAEILSIYTARGADSIISGLVRRFPMSPHQHNVGIVNPWIGDTEQSVANASSLTVNTARDEAAALPATGDLLVMTIAAGGNSGGTPPNITTPGGWTQRVHLDLPSTLSTPVLGVYTRPASSEPTSYSVSINQTCPIVGTMTAYRGPNTSPDQVATNTGTSATPQSPTVTAPASPALVIRVCSIDGVDPEPPVRGDFFPSDVRGRRVLGDRDTPNGNTLGIGEELRAAEAPGTRDWGPDVSDQWGAATLTFLYGDGNEGLPAKDFSSAKDHGESWHQVVGVKDTLKVGGC